ncbi:uncharacterized protein RCC_04675 [Ramularia collo-cygni]|uniref:Uncharacterized protein n=1 Tax=Ramularia collo-cygni TaxID=112498 RepID=A0A2D3V017_9PEZI|nr:uncharacterized protein RCC_04675 [Ramularia collo-cygni]CZT18830.1 uncharacterized protein RCC_04675 [Ramularia collo-cygni]
MSLLILSTYHHVRVLISLQELRCLREDGAEIIDEECFLKHLGYGLPEETVLKDVKVAKSGHIASHQVACDNEEATKSDQADDDSDSEADNNWRAEASEKLHQTTMSYCTSILPNPQARQLTCHI